MAASHSPLRALTRRTPRHIHTAAIQHAAIPVQQLAPPHILCQPAELTASVLPAKQAAKAARDAVVRADSLPASIMALDTLSNTLCAMTDLSCWMLMGGLSRPMATAAQQTWQASSDLIAAYNADQELAQAVISQLETTQAAYEAKEIWWCANGLAAEFRASGALLPGPERARCEMLANRIAALSRSLSENDVAEVTPLQLQESDKAALPTAVQTKAWGWLSTLAPPVVTDVATLRSITAQATQEDLRRRAWAALPGSWPNVASVAAELVCARSQIAQLVGKRSAADNAFYNRLAGSAAAAKSSLHQMLEAAGPQLESEARHMAQVAGVPLHAGGPGGVRVAEWDMLFAQQTFVAQQYPAAAQLPQFLKPERVIQTLLRVLETVFQVRLQREPAADIQATAEESVPAYVAYDAASEHKLGTMYLDMWRRPGKHTGYAQFMLQSARLVDGQLPTVLLSTPLARDLPLALPGVRSLFHEAGHVLHSLRSQAQLQHGAGTRCAVDWVEVPSTLMEHWCLLPDVLQSMCVDQVPAAVVHQAAAAAQAFPATTASKSAAYALWDLDIHDVPAEHIHTDWMTEQYRSVQQEWSPVHSAEHCLGPDRAFHLIDYGAGYYSYAYAAVLASAAWERHFVADPWSVEAASQWQRQALAPGGGTDPRHALYNALPDIAPEPVLRHADQPGNPDVAAADLAWHPLSPGVLSAWTQHMATAPDVARS